jgi:hypothetical protein
MENNINNLINLRNFNSIINFEKIIFDLLLNINKLQKSKIISSLISKKSSSSNSYFSSHSLLLYVNFPEIFSIGIMIIDSVFIYFYIVYLLFILESQLEYLYQKLELSTLDNLKIMK